MKCTCGFEYETFGDLVYHVDMDGKHGNPKFELAQLIHHLNSSHTEKQ